MCTILTFGIVVFIIWWLLSKFSCQHYVTRPVTTVVNGMKAAIAKKNGNDHHVKVDPETVKESKVHNLTQCTQESCKDIKKIDSMTKKSSDKIIKKFLEDHDTCMVFIFAPWCPHCVTAMPKYYEASTKTDVPFALINAEMVSAETLQGEKSMFNVEFFPHIMRLEKQKDGTYTKSIFKEAPDADAIVKHSKENTLQHYFD
jgi:thiol-disulfide isomerase/thioredoxin